VSRPSRPLFIGLLGTLVLVGVLFFALKPPGKGADSNSKFNAPISQAQQAVVQSQAAAAKIESATGSTTDSPAASAAPAATAAPATPLTAHHATATPATALKPHVAQHAPAVKLPALAAGDKSAPILTALAHHDVAVVLFWTSGGADDDSVRRAVAAVSHRPKVKVFAIPMKSVGKYPALTTGVSITVSPTTLVIGPDHRYQLIAGYTGVFALEQAIALARH
jgi:hypothetical protein